ncbi:MAG: T9SS type A sorting domain-containing protein [Chitinophagaceae bacterium]|nr:T9SS type A sorting domain-containing protein [Chitinophagaceae bacterium]
MPDLSPIQYFLLSFINFTALLNNNKVDVKWITTNELNVSHFIVEKSLDGIHFTNAAIVFSQISANNYANYSYTDHINQSQAEYIYYRLLTIDNNGKSQTSEVRKVQIDKAAVDALLITTYPNPVSNEIHIAIPNGWQNKKIIYEIINQAGIPVKKVEIANSTKKQIFNISQLSAGMYIIKVSCEGVAVLQKIIKI